MQGNCTDAPSQKILSAISGADLVPLAPGQCLVLLSGGVGLAAQPSSLWLHNLYLRFTESNSTSSSDGGAVILTLTGGSTWCEQVTLQGDGTSAVRGASVLGPAASASESGDASVSFSRALLTGQLSCGV